MRASQSISSKSSQISLSISCRNQGRNGEDRRLSPITGAKIKSVIASDSVPSPSTIHQKNYTFSALSDNKNSRVMIHDKRWTDGSVSWDPISPSLAGLAKVKHQTKTLIFYICFFLASLHLHCWNPIHSCCCIEFIEMYCVLPLHDCAYT